MTFSKFEEWSVAKALFDAKKEDIVAKEEQKKVLEEEIKNSKDERFIEKTAKQKLGLVSPGEKVIYILSEEDSDNSNDDKEEEKKGIIEKLKEIFVK